MLILFCGLIGCGKTTLARKTAEALGLELFEADDIKKRVYPKDPDFERNMREAIPFKDETRMEVFRQSIEALRALSATQRHLVFDETVHKAKFREFFREQWKDDGGVFIVWVRASDDTVKQRLSTGREGHILSNAAKMYDALKKEFEPITDADLVIDNDDTPENALEKILAALRTVLA